MILAWNTELSQLDGSGMTAFIKVLTTDRIRAQASVSTLSIVNAVPLWNFHSLPHPSIRLLDFQSLIHR